MAIHITPSSVGTMFMLGIAGIGFALLVDTWHFINGGQDFFSTLSIAIHLDEKVRALSEFILGICLVLFGFGIWTAQVGSIAILIAIFLASGNYWTFHYERGKAADPTVQYEVGQKHQCKMTACMKKWCFDDDDNDNIINGEDTSNKDGIRNCTLGTYLTTKPCKVVVENEECK